MIRTREQLLAESKETKQDVVSIAIQNDCVDLLETKDELLACVLGTSTSSRQASIAFTKLLRAVGTYEEAYGLTSKFPYSGPRRRAILELCLDFCASFEQARKIYKCWPAQSNVPGKYRNIEIICELAKNKNQLTKFVLEDLAR